MSEIISSLGFTPIERRLDPKWAGVKDARLMKSHDVDPTPEAINRYVNNRIKYASDRVDYWQTPEESEDRRTGDCEDFAILKRALLLRAGYDSVMIVGYDPVLRANHAVLACRDGGEIKILDCLTDKILTWKKTGMSPIMGYGDRCWVIALPTRPDAP